MYSLFRHRPEHVHTLSYNQVEFVTSLLAETLYKKYGSELPNCDFTTIPRGGTIVLGILSYYLNLNRTQQTTQSVDNPLIIVDDCCYSGARLHEALALHGNRSRIIVALLFSTKEALLEVAAQTDNVTDCLSARNLLDLIPLYETDPNLAEAWRARISGHLSANHYWAGYPELVIFPWTEPDSRIWNRETKRLEHGWRSRSPDRCLKNWADLGLPPRTAKPEFRIPDKVLYRLVDDNELYLCNPDRDDVYHLEESASVTWRALAAYQNRDLVLDHLRRAYVADENSLSSDLDRFISQLLSTHLLEKMDQ